MLVVLFCNLLDQLDRLMVPATRRLNCNRIKHMGPGQSVVFAHLVVDCQCQIGCSACLQCLAELATCASAYVYYYYIIIII